MNIEEIIELDKQNYINTYGARFPIAFERGEGIYLYSTDGRRFVDFFSGFAVNCIGHSHPRLVNALKDQVGKLLHTSNLYYNPYQAILAKMLVSRSCADKVFLCNSGAEANEGAMKLARMYFHRNKDPRHKIVTLKNSFHGRTFATLAATGQEKFHPPYQPLLQEFVYIDANNFNELSTIDRSTAAVIIEVIQGEGGVNVISAEFLQALRKQCDDVGALLIIDEVQTGIGRTGRLFGYEHTGIEPDIFTLAKGLAGGIPIGAICAKDHVAKAFEQGDHGATFGGNALACRAATTVLGIIEDEKLTENVDLMGQYFIQKLIEMESKEIKEVRGRGFMIGLELKSLAAKDICKNMLEQGYLIHTAGASVIRILPPLITKKEDINEFMKKFSEVLK